MYLDLYKILNLTYEATAEDIKASYRKLARMYHPDVDPSEDALKKFKEVKEAYDVLSDIEARKKYDVLHGFYKQKIKKGCPNVSDNLIKSIYDYLIFTRALSKYANILS